MVFHFHNRCTQPAVLPGCEGLRLPLPHILNWHPFHTCLHTLGAIHRPSSQGSADMLKWNHTLQQLYGLYSKQSSSTSMLKTVNSTCTLSVSVSYTSPSDWVHTIILLKPSDSSGYKCHLDKYDIKKRQIECQAFCTQSLIFMKMYFFWQADMSLHTLSLCYSCYIITIWVVGYIL